MTIPLYIKALVTQSRKGSDISAKITFSAANFDFVGFYFVTRDVLIKTVANPGEATFISIDEAVAHYSTQAGQEIVAKTNENFGTSDFVYAGFTYFNDSKQQEIIRSLEDRVSALEALLNP